MKEINKNKDFLINLYPEVDHRNIETSDFEKVLPEDDLFQIQGDNDGPEPDVEGFGDQFDAFRDLEGRRQSVLPIRRSKTGDEEEKTTDQKLDMLAKDILSLDDVQLGSPNPSREEEDDDPDPDNGDEAEFNASANIVNESIIDNKQSYVDTVNLEESKNLNKIYDMPSLSRRVTVNAMQVQRSPQSVQRLRNQKKSKSVVTPGKNLPARNILLDENRKNIQEQLKSNQTIAVTN